MTNGACETLEMVCAMKELLISAKLVFNSLLNNINPKVFRMDFSSHLTTEILKFNKVASGQYL